MLASLGDLFVYGVDVDWAGFDGPYARRKLRLRAYLERYGADQTVQTRLAL